MSARRSRGRIATIVALVALGLMARSSASAQESPVERISFNAAVARAIAHNPSAETAREEIRRAESLVAVARASSLPTLTANGMYTRLDADRTIGIPPNERLIAAGSALGANVILSAPLVAPRSWAQWSHASDGVDVSRAKAEDVRRQVAVAAARAYLAVMAQKRVVQASERARDTAKAHYEFAQKRHRGGLGNRIDEARARNQLASAEGQAQVAYTGLARTREALGIVLGASLPVDSAEDATLGDMPAASHALADAQQRTDVLARATAARAAQNAVRDNWTDYSPTLSATAQIFFQDPATVLLPQTGWQAQVILSIPLYDGGARYGLAGDRGAAAREARVSLGATQRQATSDVRFALEEIRRADEGLAAAREAAASAKEAMDLANVSYAEGATTNLEVIDAERTLNIAETLLVVAEDTAREARLDLLAASGHFP
jgi:outer membrane protein TolC